MDLNWRKQRADYAAAFKEGWLFDPVFKGSLNQEFSHQSQNLMHHESSGRNLLYSGLNYSMSPSAGCRTRKLNDGYNSCYFQQSSNKDQEGSSLSAASDGKSMPPLLDIMQITDEAVSPEQVSSVTASSDADRYSSRESFEVAETTVVSAFSERISDDTNALSSMIFSNIKRSHKQLSQHGLHTLPQKQCYLEHCPFPACFGISLEAQMHGFSVGQQKYSNQVPAERPSKPSQLSLEKLHKFQQQGFFTVQASNTTNSKRSMHNILFSYLNYKTKVVDACRSQQEFIDYLHSTLCKSLICECEKYWTLISHFDNCHSDCNICGPVHQLFHIKKIKSGPVSDSCSIKKVTSVSGKPQEYFSGNLHPRDHIIQHSQPTSKRMKIENAALHDDWSLGAVVFPYLNRGIVDLTDDEENTMEMNKEHLSFKEAPITALNRTVIAENGGLESKNVFLRNTDGLLGVGQSFEVRLNSGTLRKDIPRPIGSLEKTLRTVTDAFDNNNLENNDAFPHSEDLKMVAKKQEMECASASKVKCDATLSFRSLHSDGISVFPERLSPIGQVENTKLIPESDNDRIDRKCDSAVSDYPSGKELEDLEVSGVSLTDFFSAEQIKEHLHSLDQDIDLSFGKEQGGNTTAHSGGANTCQLCAVDGLMFAAPPMYCTVCSFRIRHKSTYYCTMDETGPQYCFCSLCFNKARGGNISFGELSFSKENLVKSKNTAEFSEAWVRCDKCESWQHQICALYNSKRDLGGKVSYICPVCRLSEIEVKGPVSIPPSFGATDLPRTKLSEHIEQRLFRSLEQERKQRAELLGKSAEEVPGAADLVVRVVLDVNKQLKVKQQFLDIFHGEPYPTEFLYKSKVILLFQKVHGVDVCIFAMYVQEFGSGCGDPNKRSVYISYLDSVKYFRPEIRTVDGMALRTFVYHEILIGYLDYCKQCGFNTCYIWACPPLKGEDYILYCHPETQKRPNPNKLLQWYKKMLRKAKDDNVVVECTNFYDHFFVQRGECNSKITAARLPYFDGDYWSGAVEDIIRTIEKESGGDYEGMMKNQMTRRTLKAMGYDDFSVDTAKDIIVMQKLGQKIQPVKEGFFVVQLQFTCTNCHESILSGNRWSCNQCSQFHLCSRCLELKHFASGFETHTSTHGDKHQLFQIPANDVPADIEDKDVLLDNDFLDNRHSFLNFCQKNHYQFDSLRRAKHSSMMILHHLHKTTAVTMQTNCSLCHEDVIVKWHCEICSEFHVCNACYQGAGNRCHAHKLVQHLAKSDRRTNSDKMQKQSAAEIRVLLDLLEHANQCRSSREHPCLYPKCFHVKKLFLHNRECKSRIAGGCSQCKKIWFLLCVHSENCRDSNCKIPRCMDLKNHKEMIATQADNRRRAAAAAGQPPE